MIFLRKLVVLPIRFYRRFISPLKPPTCRFHPTCSAYGQEAILSHGLIRGTALLIWRILRCQPFCEGGLDPVPPARKSSKTPLSNNNDSSEE
ncbi:MAG: putative membrane protein insertion efficiency factor [Planctomycetota bacterium]|jgi:putative membrane protein insertion efficiency factor